MSLRHAGLTVLALALGCSRADPPGKALTSASTPTPPPKPSTVASAAGDASSALPAPSVAAPRPTPEGYRRVTVGGVAPTSAGNAVLLIESSRALAVPIFVGETEALSIQLRLQKRHYPRPLTHDLLERMLHGLGGRVVEARVDALRDNVFHASVRVQQLTTGKGASEQTFDSRASDAVALAIGSQAPIFVHDSVLTRTGVSLDDVELPEDDGEPSPSSRPLPAQPPEIQL